MPLSLTDVLRLPIERPRCARCRTRLDLATIDVRPDRSEKRTFECPKCNFIETMIVADPVKSEKVNRLVDSVKPPE